MLAPAEPRALLLVQGERGDLAARARCLNKAGVACLGRLRRRRLADGVCGEDRGRAPTWPRRAFVLAPGRRRVPRISRGDRCGVDPMRVLDRAHVRERAFSDVPVVGEGSLAAKRGADRTDESPIRRAANQGRGKRSLRCRARPGAPDGRGSGQVMAFGGPRWCGRVLSGSGAETIDPDARGFAGGRRVTVTRCLSARQLPRVLSPFLTA
jgi:hypothetical protein